MSSLILPLLPLRQALSGLGKIISKRPALAVLGQVHVRRYPDGSIELTATDLERSATYRVPGAAPAEPLTLLLPYTDLLNVARSATDSGAVEIEAVDPCTVALRFRLGDQSVEHRAELADAATFPLPPVLDPATVQEAPLDPELRDALGEAMACASTDSTRLVLKGACLDVSKPGAHYVVATDGRHLFAANSFTLPLRESVILPDHKFLGWKGFVQDGDWRLRSGRVARQDARQHEVVSDHWRFVARGVDGDFPNWRQVVPEPAAFRTQLEVDPDRLEVALRAVQSLPVAAGDVHQLIGLDLRAGQAQLLARSRVGAEWTQLSLPASAIAGPAVRVFLNRTYLLKALRFGLHQVEIIDPVSPLKFSREGRMMIVMPLRGHAEEAQAGTASAPSAESMKAPPVTEAPVVVAEAEALPVVEAPVAVTEAEASPVAPVPAPPTSALERACAQTDTLRSGLRELLQRLSPLQDSLRQALREQRASERDLQSVRHTLRSLQNVRL